MLSRSSGGWSSWVLGLSGVSLPLLCFLQNWSISRVLEATPWRSNSVFASFYIFDGVHSLGPSVAVGYVVNPTLFGAN